MTPRKLIEPARLAGTAVLRGQSDERLIDLTRAGNEKAFEAIVHRYRAPLLRYCGRILPPGRAEDAVQQTFLNAYSAISSGENQLKLRPWLYRIAHNSALNLLRQNGWNHEQLDEQYDGVLRPDQAVEGRERIHSLVAAVKDLPERQRDAIVLRELEGRSYDEIAAALGVTDGAVRQLLNRARTTLRAGATAVTPYGLAARLAMAASGGGPVGERIAEICTGAGGVATLAKFGTAALLAGALATSAVDHGVPGIDGGSGHHRQSASDVTASGGSGAARADASHAGGAPGLDGLDKGHGSAGRADGRRSDSHRHGHPSSEQTELVSEHSGTGGTSGGDGHSGSGSSGSGSSGSGSSGSSDGGSSGTSGSTDGGMSGSSSSGSGSSDGGSTTTTITTPTQTTTTSDGGGTSGGPH